MKTPEEIKKIELALIDFETTCGHCPYEGEPNGCNRPGGICKMFDVALDAAEAIKQLEAQQPRWISVKEREPEHDGLYYCHTAIWGDIMCRYANGIWVDDRAKFTNYPRRPTHWLEILDIPHPPEEENENVT